MNSSGANESGSFRTPSTNSDIRIGVIQNELLRVQTQIGNLTSALVSGDASDVLRTRLATLEGDFQSLKEQLADEQRKSSIANDKYDVSTTTLTNLYNAVDTQLKTLQASMERIIEEESNRRMPTDIVEEIRSHRFSAAESIVVKMANNDKIYNIIHEVYANSQGNVNIILDFAGALRKIDISYYVLSALRYEMSANGHRDPYKMMALVKALEKEVVNQKNVKADVKANAQTVINETVADIESAATETLKAAMYSDNYKKNVQVEKLANAIDDFRSEVSDRVMERIVKEAHPAVSAIKIADNMYSNKYIPQIVSGLVALFWKMQSINDLNNAAVLSIGDYLKRLQKMPNFVNLTAEKKSVFNEVVNSMPTCAKNLFFSKTVCIVNRANPEHLYAASSPFNWDKERRSIFTWREGESVKQGYWYVENINGQFHFKKTVHNEYMYAATYKPYSKDERNVWAWIPGDRCVESAWTVELHGNYCYLKNNYFDEYLYASNKMYDSERRRVFTWIEGSGVRDQRFQWQIISGD